MIHTTAESQGAGAAKKQKTQARAVEFVVCVCWKFIRANIRARRARTAAVVVASEV